MNYRPEILLIVGILLGVVLGSPPIVGFAIMLYLCVLAIRAVTLTVGWMIRNW